jgi:formate hydrogenlyase transcriptional activator
MDDARAHQRLRLLLDITNRMVTKLELRGLLREIVASIRQCMQCDKVGVALPDPEDGELRRYVSDHAGCEEMSVGSVSERTRIVFRTGKPLIATRKELAAEFEGAIGLNSLCVYPLKMRERVLGVFGLESSRENAFTEDDLTFLGQVANQIAIAVENALAYGQISELKDKLAQENVYLESEIRSELHFEDIVGNSEPLRRVLREIETVAPANSTVLIYGETGTGKELIARAVHNLSSRKSNPFVKLNCAAIPTGLIESELFGHEKGAFTGAAVRHAGKFEQAHRGTLFLDEIGDMPAAMQAKLLRVLEEGEIERVGGSQPIRVDVRVVVATHRNLEEQVKSGGFRQDLFHRIFVFPIVLPPLRDRKGDIPVLIEHFARTVCEQNGWKPKAFTPGAIRLLERHAWPGNIRELRNCVERLLLLADTAVDEDIVELALPHRTEPPPVSGTLAARVESFERETILAELKRQRRNMSETARVLGLERSHLYKKCAQVGIDLQNLERE